MSILLYAKRIYFAPHMEKFIISLENLNKSGVYALICMITNKQYIGSSVKLGARFLDYMQPAYLGRRPNSPLIKAILKYGYINFCFAVLETCKPSEVLEREQYWLDLIHPEYNLSPTAGSTLGIYLSEETKAKLSAAHLGKLSLLRLVCLCLKLEKALTIPGLVINTARKLKLKCQVLAPLGSVSRDRAAKQGALNPHYGKPRSIETITLMRANHPHTKRVYQYDLDRLTLISQYASIRQAAELTGISRGYIERCIKQNKAAHDKCFFTLTPY